MFKFLSMTLLCGILIIDNFHNTVSADQIPTNKPSELKVSAMM
jgi:hypothetical protein